jgi:choline dehydrogenase-like flavoprotein
MRYEYRQRLWDARLPLTQRHLHMRNVLRHPMRLATFMASMLHKRYLSDRRIPSLALFAPDNRYGLEFHSEQAPNPDSRITLAEERDAFGMPRLHVDWRWNALDMQTVRKSYNLLATELERTGTGRLRFDQDRLEDIVLAHGAFGGHHIGTARMSDNPANGVVDRNCQVHGIANLFLAGSTVFPTSSQANPTLTALALAFRLADHLKEQAVGSLRMAPQRERVFGDNV